MTKAKRPERLPGSTYKLVCGCGPVYVTVNDLEGKPFEVFIRLGKAGGCGSAFMEGMGKTLSLALRSGADPGDLPRLLGRISCHKPLGGRGADQVTSCMDAVARVVEMHLALALEAAPVQRAEA